MGRLRLLRQVALTRRLRSDLALADSSYRFNFAGPRNEDLQGAGIAPRIHICVPLVERQRCFDFILRTVAAARGRASSSISVKG